jgi:nucleotide-binding universal stress UspA family protein
MHKLLVAIDGSASATHALEFALGLAKRKDPVTLHLLTVRPEAPVYGEIQVYVSQERMDELQSQHSLDILQPAIELAKASGVPCTSEVAVGEIARTIARRAEELECDGIVMGTRGMGGIGSLVMGSIATKVVHLAKVPVTLVK